MHKTYTSCSKCRCNKSYRFTFSSPSRTNNFFLFFVWVFFLQLKQHFTFSVAMFSFIRNVRTIILSIAYEFNVNARAIIALPFIFWAIVTGTLCGCWVFLSAIFVFVWHKNKNNYNINFFLQNRQAKIGPKSLFLL